MSLTQVKQSNIDTSASQLYGMRNRIINGAMMIDQRNAGASVTVSSTAQTFSVDRWWASGQATDGVFTMQQSSTAPAGFSNSLAVTVTTADASIGSTQRYYLAQRIEGFNTADLGWGTASAATVTLSFWVRSSLTGTFGGFIYNSAADYTYPFSYSISSANTWEQKTITITGPTAGTWIGATNGVGMHIGWSIGAGSTYLSTAGAWAASQYFGATGQTNLIGTNGATFYITGVQLEIGTVATPFDYRPYGTELQLCQRYYWQVSGVGGSLTGCTIDGLYAASSGNGLTFSYMHPVVMRSAPTATTLYNDLTNASSVIVSTSVFGVSVTAAGGTSGSGRTAYNFNSSGYVKMSAEL